MAIVGITGRKYHGKDTLARQFVARGFVQMRFADPLKEMLRAFYRTAGVDQTTVERKMEGDLKEIPCPHLRGRTPRHAMQTLGTEWGRQHISDDLWVSTLRHRAETAGADVVVSDVRFPNECAAIKAAGGTVYRVEAHDRVSQNEFSAHPSEVEVDRLPVDGIVENNGPAAHLGAAVDAILRDLRVADLPRVQAENAGNRPSQESVTA